MVLLNPSQLRDARKVADTTYAYERLRSKKSLSKEETLQLYTLGDSILLAGASLAKHLKGGITSNVEYNKRQWWKPW